MHSACYRGDIEHVKELVRSGVDVNEKDTKHGATPLHMAAFAGHIHIVTYLLKQGAKVNATDLHGQSVIASAVFNGRYEISKALLQEGADPNICDECKMNALHNAAFQGHKKLVELLLEAGCDATAKDLKGLTPAELAKAKGHEDIAQLLLNSTSWKTFVDAIESDDVKTVTWYLNQDPQKLDGPLLERDNCSPLFVAAVNEKTACLSLLIKKGASLGFKEANRQTTALHWACYNGQDGVAKLLIDNSAPLEVKEDTGQTPLSWAARKGRANIVQWLLAAGAKVDNPDNGGRTPLHFAIESEHFPVVRLLIKNGANIHLKPGGGSTPFEDSQSSYCKSEEIRLFLEEHNLRMEQQSCSEGDKALTRQGLFQLVTDEVFCDGVLEEHEKKIMSNLSRFLKLSSDEAKAIARQSKEKFKQGLLKESRRFHSEKLYTKVLEHVMADGQIDDLEAQMLTGLRKLLNISQAFHDETLAKLGQS